MNVPELSEDQILANRERRRRQLADYMPPEFTQENKAVMESNGNGAAKLDSNYEPDEKNDNIEVLVVVLGTKIHTHTHISADAATKSLLPTVCHCWSYDTGAQGPPLGSLQGFVTRGRRIATREIRSQPSYSQEKACQVCRR